MQRYNLRPRPLTKPKFFRLLDAQRFPRLAASLFMIENQDLRQARLAAVVDPALFIPLDDDPDYHPSESEASDDESADFTDTLSAASSTDLFGLEVAPMGSWRQPQAGISPQHLKPPRPPATTPLHKKTRREKRRGERRSASVKQQCSRYHKYNKPQSSSSSPSTPQSTPSGTLSPEPQHGRDSD